jgi:hypothetical protein
VNPINDFRDPAPAQALSGGVCGGVAMRTNFGGDRLVDLLAGDQVSRIR